jgi:hypothetical protein
MYVFEGITAISAVLGAFTLLTVCKLATDIIWNDPEGFDDAVLIILVGSVLSAVLLFSKF